MRGKGRCTLQPKPHSGITPAYAGKSPRRCHYLHRPEDHPRLCGEKLSDFSIIANVLGSPPPMRGKVYSLTRFSNCSRITPAYAGKSEGNN